MEWVNKEIKILSARAQTLLTDRANLGVSTSDFASYYKVVQKEFEEKTYQLRGEPRHIWTWDYQTWYKENIEPLSHVYIPFKVKR
jgi:hypothetical protein